MTTHVALTARAFGASGFILADIEDKSIKENVERVVADWGGTFSFEMGVPWRKAIAEWKTNRGLVVHLTMYGESITDMDLVSEIRASEQDIMVIVGSQKVPGELYSERFSDYNVSVGGQPHSEVAALAIFLDRLFEGRELLKEFENARIKVHPCRRGKSLNKLEPASLSSALSD